METEEHTTGRLHKLADVIRACQDQDLPAVVVGRWVWVSFDSKPPDATRDFLKRTGFRWNDHRKAWAHNCGYYSRRDPTGDPRDKYGTIPVQSFTREELEAKT